MMATHTRTTQQAIDQLTQRQLALPALLFLRAHAPLRFFAGQVLLVATPLASLIGLDAVEEWALILTDPEACAELLQTVEAADA